MKASASKILPSASSSENVGSVIVKSESGELITLPADVVVAGVGVAPATEYLKASKGFEQLLDRTGAIAVDEFLKVKGLDGSVFAIGKLMCHALDMRLTAVNR